MLTLQLAGSMVGSVLVLPQTMGLSIFRQIDNGQPDLGCSEVTPLSYLDSHNQSLIDLRDFTTTPSIRISETSMHKV